MLLVHAYRVEVVIKATQHIAVSSTAAKKRQFCLEYATTNHLQISQTKYYIPENIALTFLKGHNIISSKEKGTRVLGFFP